MGLVVFNGAFNYHLNPLGDCLTLVAALSWAVYCMLLKRLNATYSNMFINRKVFFYGLLTAMLWAIPSNSLSFESVGWQSMAVIGNLLFLGVGASFLCYLMWNGAVKILGVEKTANYIYLVPPITIAASAILISEPISLSMIIGTVLIIGGVFLSTKS